jgi:predicted O-methyltransferase YrrM
MLNLRQRSASLNKTEFLEKLSTVTLPDLGGFAKGNAGGQAVRQQEGQLLYGICTVFLPKTVLETGTHTGCSTNYLLKYAKEHNSTVDSFDVEGRAGEDLMPDLTGNLTLHKPKKRLLSKKVTSADIELIREKVLETAAKGVDLFFHDSDHSYDNAKWEYDNVTPFMKKGSVVLLHDVLQERHGTRQLFDEIECEWKHIFDTPNGLGIIVL